MLQKIFETKRGEVAAAKEHKPLSELKAEAESVSPPRGFLKALKTDHRELALIAEVKKASPSKGLIRENFNPVEIARSYETSGATALSVLTDVPYFQGSPEYLKKIREAVAIPLLRKDFIFDPYQIYEAKAWGADALLLIVAMLEKPLLTELYQEAKERGLDVLVEIHDETEAEIALDLKADFIGVNNRDLSNFKTDLSTSQRLIKNVAPHAFAVSESALETYSDLERVRDAGAKAVLIGTTFCAAEDIESKVREVMRWPKIESQAGIS